jgi:hypothetical protein
MQRPCDDEHHVVDHVPVRAEVQELGKRLIGLQDRGNGSTEKHKMHGLVMQHTQQRVEQSKDLAKASSAFRTKVKAAQKAWICSAEHTTLCGHCRSPGTLPASHQPAGQKVDATHMRTDGLSAVYIAVVLLLLLHSMLWHSAEERAANAVAAKGSHVMRAQPSALHLLLTDQRPVPVQSCKQSCSNSTRVQPTPASTSSFSKKMLDTATAPCVLLLLPLMLLR